MGHLKILVAGSEDGKLHLFGLPGTQQTLKINDLDCVATWLVRREFWVQIGLPCMAIT
jgi:hypothetical protein